MRASAPAHPESPRTTRRKWAGFAGIAGLAITVAIVISASVFLFVLRSCACQTPTTPPPIPASPVDGVVVSVDAASLGEVRGFDLRTSDGAVYRMKLGRLENETEFSPSHLAEHQATSSPIRAWYLLDNGFPTVYRLEDASG